MSVIKKKCPDCEVLRERWEKNCPICNKEEAYEVFE